MSLSIDLEKARDLVPRGRVWSIPSSPRVSSESYRVGNVGDLLSDGSIPPRVQAVVSPTRKHFWTGCSTEEADFRFGEFQVGHLALMRIISRSELTGSTPLVPNPGRGSARTSCRSWRSLENLGRAEVLGPKGYPSRRGFAQASEVCTKTNCSSCRILFAADPEENF